MQVRRRHRKAARIAYKHGFSQVMTRHIGLFYPRGDTLIVGFDNMKSRDMPAPAFPWGYSAIAAQGYSHLGIMMSRRNDWFRHKDLDAFFDGLREQEFFDQFRRVVFFGASMGGYAALSFCSACPSADVVVFAPQTSLDPSVVPFETRYRSGFSRGDWSGPYADAAFSARSARQVMVFADPYHKLDVAHVNRLPKRNLRWMRCPNFGHNPARILKHMDLLKPVMHDAWAGTLTPSGFTKAQREKRFVSQGLARSVFGSALSAGHPKLVQTVAENLERKNADWAFPRLIAMAKKEQDIQRRAVA